MTERIEMYQGEFRVGDKVNAYDRHFTEHHGREDLVVLYMDEDVGYGIGPIGNDPDVEHNIQDGWVWYFPEEVSRRG